MSLNILMLSEQTLKDRTAIDSNVDSKLIQNTIKYCQDIYIEPVVGTTLYEKLQTIIGDNTIVTDGTLVQYKKLVDQYLTDMLLYYVISEMPFVLSYKFYNKNIISKTSDNSQSPTMPELVDIISFYKQKGEYYEQRAIRWLRQVVSLNYFPEYMTQRIGLDVIRPKRSGYSCSIPLEKAIDMTKVSIPELYQGSGNWADIYVTDLELR